MIYIIYTFILGTLFGSFILVFSTRALKGEDYIKSRSYCESCHQNLKWYNLIPLISYIFQKGKCSNCKAKIPFITFLIELITGLLFAYMFYLYGLSYDFFIGIIISCLLINICITDFKEYIILNEPLILSTILIIALMIYYHDLNFLLLHLATGFMIFGFFLLTKKIGDILFKRESLGGGDIKFSFIIGLILGFQLSLNAVILSTFLALPTSVAALKISKNREIPYGPFLVGALLLVFLNADKFYIII